MKRKMREAIEEYDEVDQYEALLDKCEEVGIRFSKVEDLTDDVPMHNRIIDKLLNEKPLTMIESLVAVHIIGEHIAQTL